MYYLGVIYYKRPISRQYFYAILQYTHFSNYEVKSKDNSLFRLFCNALTSIKIQDI